MRKLTIFSRETPVRTAIWLVIPHFFNGFKAYPPGIGAIDAGGIINDCPAQLAGTADPKSLYSKRPVRSGTLDRSSGTGFKKFAGAHSFPKFVKWAL